MYNQPMKTKTSGFTLIELLVVISIIGTLVGLIVNNMASARARARDSSKKSGLTQLKTALRLYYNDYQQYPEGNGFSINGCGDGDDPCTPGGTFSAGLPDPTIYMRQLPPSVNYQSGLVAGLTNDEFIAKAILENASDPDILPSQEACPCASCSFAETEYIVCAD